ncbi:hypothetical protein RHGRI_006469 [Rhododendron griersonianum]|uniref:Pyrroline-5-carboxylate reductase n=1 Tax=Rhododendron griersonianum TaxID=479676 RepID=A0AAV6KU91_9ERIC|nr:hypothetical protein RHGRI_006469 [Rhododendron griersonianum]
MAAGVVSVPIPNDTYKLGFIGSGKMAESIARGVVNSGVLPASRIRTAHLGSSRRSAFESFGVKVFDRNVEVVEDCDVIIFSVKPQIGSSNLGTSILSSEPSSDGLDFLGLASHLMTFFHISSFIASSTTSVGLGLWRLSLNSYGLGLFPVLTKAPSQPPGSYMVKSSEPYAGALYMGLLLLCHMILCLTFTCRNSLYTHFFGKYYILLFALAIMLFNGFAVKEVVLQLKPLLSEKLLVSVAAGVKLIDLQDWAGHSRFIRVIPNTPAAVGEAASVMSLGAAATEDDGELIARLFGAIGKIWKADEKLFDAITGLSGSGPAYIYLAIEALADGGVAAGLPRELALGLASQTVLGAASMVSKGGKHPGQLKDDVASPGGTTIAGIHELEKGGFRGILMNAVVAATKRSQEFSKR